MCSGPSALAVSLSARGQFRAVIGATHCVSQWSVGLELVDFVAQFAPGSNNVLDSCSERARSYRVIQHSTCKPLVKSTKRFMYSKAHGHGRSSVLVDRALFSRRYTSGLLVGVSDDCGFSFSAPVLLRAGPSHVTPIPKNGRKDKE